MSDQSIVIIESGLSYLNPYRDEAVDQDFPLEWFHNGVRGIHHTSERCLTKGKSKVQVSRSTLSLNQAKNKRLCPNCFKTGMLGSFFDGGKVYNHLLELSNQIDSTHIHLATENLSIHQLTEIIEKSHKFQAMSIKEDNSKYHLVEEGNQILFNNKVLLQAEKFSTFLEQRLEEYRVKVEHTMVANYLSIYAEEHLDKFFKEDELKPFSNPRSERNSKTTATNVLRTFYTLRGKSTPIQEIKQQLYSDMKTIAITDIDQLSNVPMINSIDNLKSTVELSWESYKLTILETLIERWERLYLKQLENNKETDLLLVDTSELWRAEQLKVLFPYFQVQADKSKELVILKTPRFITQWAQVSSSSNNYTMRNMERVIKVYEEKAYTPSQLSTALVLYEPGTESIYQDFSVALTAAATL
jgi:hypothetical protein